MSRLSSWPLVAAVFNLEVATGLRDGPFITAKQARRMAIAAQRKLMRALVAAGEDRCVVLAFFQMRDADMARRHENLAALLPPPTRTRDESDPSPTRSLRTSR